MLLRICLRTNTHWRIASKPNVIVRNLSSETSSSRSPEQNHPVRRKRSKIRSIVELMRWHKPTGTLLALTPSLWTVGMLTPSTTGVPDLNTFAIFTAGAIVARGMGCTLNDILDRKYDRQVERTKMRPIANGDISVKEALFYLAIQSSLGLYILCLNNFEVIKLGLFSGVMIATYPLFKRFTYWPQAMLALTINWGVVMGYAASKGAIGLHDLTTLLPIYLGSIFWTLYYDTIYAHQDKNDDMFIGVKSTALRLGGNTKSFLRFVNIGMTSSLMAAGLMTEQLWPYYLAVIGAGYTNGMRSMGLNLDNQEACWKEFNVQRDVGIIILAGVLLSVFLKSKIEKEDQENSIENPNKIDDR